MCDIKRLAWYTTCGQLRQATGDFHTSRQYYSSQKRGSHNINELDCLLSWTI
jgi:hypothetical protein